MTQPPPPYGYPYVNPKAYDTSLATAALVLAIASVSCGVTWIGGIVMGHVALGKIKRGEAGGKPLAITALVISYGFFALVLAFAALIFITALMQNR